MIYKLIISHLIGDYVLQTNYIANNKGKNYYILFIHCALYTLPLYLFFGFTWHLVVVFALHIIIDYLKAFKGAFSIWVDQTIHYVTLAIYFI